MSATVTEKRPTTGVMLLDRDRLDACVQCGMCLTSCPTYRELRVEMDSPRGRIFLMKSVLEGRLEPDALFARHMYLCLDCRACETACPTGVPFGLLVDAARAVIEQNRRLPLVIRILRDLVFRQLLPHGERLRLLGMLLRGMERLGLLTLARRIVSGRLQEALQLLPDCSAPPFVPGDVTATASGSARRGKVALFWGCVAPVLLPNVQRATVAVLRSYGYEVVVPEGQTCCGAFHLHHGLRDDAQALARRNLSAFDGAGYETIIVNAAGCGATLKAYPELLRGTTAEGDANRFRIRVKDLSEFLAPLPDPPQSASLKAIVTYQDPCHLAHGQRIRSEPRQLLKAIPGLEVKEMPEAERCCGSAGIYNILHPEMSLPLRQTKIDYVRTNGARIIVTANPGCQLYLQAGIREKQLDVEVLHLAELLVRAYGTRPGG